MSNELTTPKVGSSPTSGAIFLVVEVQQAAETLTGADKSRKQKAPVPGLAQRLERRTRPAGSSRIITYSIQELIMASRWASGTS